MKIRWLMFTVLLLAPIVVTIHAEEPPKAGNSGVNCPIFMIDEYPPDGLYYCDYVEDSMCNWLDVTYWFGEIHTPVPYVNCPGDCYGSHAKVAPAAPRSEFTGIPTKVPLDFMHVRPPHLPDPAPKGTPAVAPGLVVNNKRDRHYVKFTWPLPNGPEHYAKVIEFRFSRPVGKARKGPPGADGTEQSFYLAYECESNPAEKGYEVHPVAELRSGSGNLGAFGLKGRTCVEVGQSEPVTILLVATDKAAK